MVHDFSRIPSANIPRSSFNMSQAYKTTFDAGYLIPIFVQEVVPGDTHSVTCHQLARLATPLKPFMDNVHIETFFFFCPNRLTWEHWPNFMGETDSPGDTTDYTVPTFSDGTVELGDTADYMGLPLGAAMPGISALPFRALHLIFNEWFRAQDIVQPQAVDTGDGPDTFLPYKTLFRRGKRHDYFTSCLPWPQFGPGVELPLGTVAPVSGIGVESPSTITNTPLDVRTTNGEEVGDITWDRSYQSGDGVNVAIELQDVPSGYPAIYTDLSQATAATINELRQAFQIQKLQERDARGGHRYQELVLSHFGVRGGDARLNRPEYLGGGQKALGIVQIPQTAPDDAGGDNTPQGNLAAYGVSTGKSGFTKSFTEHGYIIGLVNARADLTYQKGIDRHWSRETKYDFYWPALAKIGEQAVLNKEIFVTNDDTDNDIFGYQERWAEMKHNNSKITGLFRSDAAGTLDYWHLSQDFANRPVLNELFINDDPPIDRVIAVQDEPHFLFDAYFQHKAARPMPVNGAPGYIDHF